MDRDGAARAALIASVIGGTTYVASWSLPLGESASLAWKGTGVGFLALYAALKARSVDGWMLTAVMALGCLGDVLLRAEDMTVGGVAFLLGHLLAAALYLRNRRPANHAADWVFAGLLVPAVAVAAFLLPTERSGATGIAIYAGAGALMAAALWLSRFPRQVAGAGALMFVVSDLLIFARIGPLAGQPWINLAVWGLYYGGQALICGGVARGLARTASEHAGRKAVTPDDHGVAVDRA